MGPSWDQIPPKSILKSIQKLIYFRSLLGLILIDLGAQNESQEGDPEIDVRGFWDSWGNLGAMLGPRWSKSLPRQLFGPMLIDFGTYVYRFLMIWGRRSWIVGDLRSMLMDSG